MTRSSTGARRRLPGVALRLQGARGPARPPATLAGLVVSQGQARSRRDGDRCRRPRGRGRDRAAGQARHPAARSSSTSSAAASPRSCTTGARTRRPMRTSRRTSPNAEIDDVRWVRLSKARKQLEYEHDVDLLDTFAVVRLRQQPADRSSGTRAGAQPQAVVRRRRRAPAHRCRRTATPSDSSRCCSAYGITQVVTSDSARCVDTVLPYVNSRSGRSCDWSRRSPRRRCARGSCAS